jgi:hypothetical protein
MVPPTPATPNSIPARAVMTPTESTFVTSSYVKTPVNVAATPVMFLIVITGVAATFTGVLTYEDVTNVDSVGVITARAGIEFGVAGVGGTITADGHAEFAGVCTATEYYGDGSNLTGISASISTTSSSPAATTTASSTTTTS